MGKKKTEETMVTEAVELEKAEEQPEAEQPKETEKQPEAEQPEETEKQPEAEQPEETEKQPEAEQPEEAKEQPEKEAAKPEVLFHVTTIHDFVALRITPEFRLDGKNVLGKIHEKPGEKNVYKVTEVRNGYGKLQYPAGAWIDLKACNRK